MLSYTYPPVPLNVIFTRAGKKKERGGRKRGEKKGGRGKKGGTPFLSVLEFPPQDPRRLGCRRKKEVKKEEKTPARRGKKKRGKGEGRKSARGCYIRIEIILRLPAPPRNRCGTKGGGEGGKGVPGGKRKRERGGGTNPGDDGGPRPSTSFAPRGQAEKGGKNSEGGEGGKKE